MPIKIKNRSNGHNPDVQEMPQTVEAEMVEEDEMLATESFTTSDSDVGASVEIKVGLRSLIPETAADYQAGFKLLTDPERAEYAIKSDRSLYRVREDAGKNLFNLSSQRVGQHVRELLESKPPYPRGYLIDEQGLTDRCIYEIFKKIENTAKNILPGSPSDWRNLKKSKKEFNPRWKTHRFQYLTEHTNRCRDYYNWLEAQPQPDVEVHQAEFMPDEPPEDREERLSKKRSQIQKTETEFENVIREYMRNKREIALLIVEEEALETKHQIDLRHDEVVNNPDTTAPPELDEDEDL
jgi:hypothetical protein